MALFLTFDLEVILPTLKFCRVEVLSVQFVFETLVLCVCARVFFVFFLINFF